MSKYRFILILIYLVLIPFGFIFSISLSFANPPNRKLGPFIFSSQHGNNYSKVIPNDDQDTMFKSILTEAAHFAFTNYYENCASYDEFRPISKKCLNNYGFSVTLFESLETLYFLNMSDDFKKAKNYILNFKLDNREYINLHEFWSRGIASLISIFLLSGDPSFLFKASELADQVLVIKSGDFINAKTEKSLYLFPGRFFLSNWLSGVPEIIILHEFVQKPIYTEFIMETITKDSKLFLYPTRKTKKLINEPIFNYFTTSFIKNAKLIDQLLTQNDRNSSINNNYQMNHDKYSFVKISKRFLKKYKQFKSSSPSEIIQSSQLFQFLKKNSFEMDKEDDKKYGDNKYMFGFNFKGDEIFDLSQRGRFDVVKNITINSLLKYRTKNGFCGTTTSSIGKKYPDDIQHTEFLGEWLKVGAMIACGYKFLFNKGIFNEYGHLLKIVNEN